MLIYQLINSVLSVYYIAIVYVCMYKLFLLCKRCFTVLLHFIVMPFKKGLPEQLKRQPQH